MDEKRLAHVPSQFLVLATIKKLHDLQKGYIQRGVLPIREHIQKVLKEIYHRDLSTRQIDDILNNLQKQDLVFKKKGLLRKKHVVIFGINSSKLFQEAFTVIKTGFKEGYAVNGYEGLVYDPPSLETLFAYANRWFPDHWDAALMEDLEEALRTWAMGAKTATKELSFLELFLDSLLIC